MTVDVVLAVILVVLLAVGFGLLITAGVRWWREHPRGRR